MSPPSDGSFPCGGAPGSCCHVVNAHRFRLMANPWMWFLSVVEELDLDVQAPFAGKFSYPRSGKCCARGACSQMLAFMLTAWVASRSGSGWRAVSPSCVMNSMVGHSNSFIEFRGQLGLGGGHSQFACARPHLPSGVFPAVESSIGFSQVVLLGATRC